jgi:hypothetical protein
MHTGFANPIRKVPPTRPFPVRPRLHFSDFGIAGDGQSDDFLTITAALNAISEMPINTLVAWPDDAYLIDGDTEIPLVINASNVTLDFKGARMTGNHRIKFDGDSGIDGDRSAMLSNVHVKNLTTNAINGYKCPKAPRMNWCRDSSMVNIEKNGRTGTAFNLFCCERVTIQNCSAIRGNDDGGTTNLNDCYDSEISNCPNKFGFLIHLCDDTIIENCVIDGRDYDEGRDYPLWYGLQVKGGNNNIVRNCRCVNLRNSDHCCVNACFRDRGDAPWGPSKTGRESPTPTYPYESIDSLSGVNLWLYPDTRRASNSTTFEDCIVENCDGHAFFVRESINTSFDNCSATRDDSMNRLNRINCGFRVRNMCGGEESNITISRCSTLNYRTGISIEGASPSNLLPDSTIERSRIVGSTNVGIEFINTDNCTAKDCIVFNTIDHRGIQLKGTNIAPHVEHCISSDNQECPTQTKGILIKDYKTNYAIINDCLCLNNTIMQIEDNGTETELSDNFNSEDQFLTLEIDEEKPSVAEGSEFKTANESGTTIKNFEDGEEGQTITVLINDANTTICENEHILLFEDSAIGPEMHLLTFKFTLRAEVWRENIRSWWIP